MHFKAMTGPESNRPRVAIPQRGSVAAIACRSAPTPNEFAASVDEYEIVIDSVKRHGFMLRFAGASRFAFDQAFAFHGDVAPSLEPR